VHTVFMHVLTVWASVRDPAFIQDSAFIRTLTSEPPTFIRGQCLFDTRRLL